MRNSLLGTEGAPWGFVPNERRINGLKYLIYVRESSMIDRYRPTAWIMVKSCREQALFYSILHETKGMDIMMKLTNCTTEAQFASLEHLYMETFPAAERKPFPLMVEKSREGVMELLAIEGEGGAFLGLAMTVLYRDLVLLDYFAISPKLRGQEIGSGALRLLQGRYAGKRLVLEIEDTGADAPNREERIRRKAFYLRNGMAVMPFLVDLFGVKMQVLTNGADVSFAEYHGIYRASFPEKISSNITLYKENPAT